MLSVDLGADSVYVYRLDNGKLALQQQLVLPAGTGPRHLAFHPDGVRAYLACETNPVVTVLGWAPVGGPLTARDVVPAVPEGSPGPNYPGEIAVSPDGRFVHVSVRGENTIATFTVDGGGITRLGENVATGGDWPRHFAVCGRWVYVSNQRSGTVTWLPVGPGTGRPGPMAGSLSVPAVAMVLFA